MAAEVPPWPPVISTLRMRLNSNLALFTSPLTKTTQRSARAGGRWEFDVAFNVLDDLRAANWRGFLSYCQDEGLSFLWSPYPKGRPYNYPGADGTYPWGTTPLIMGAGQTGRTLAVDGLTAGASFVQGDYVAFDNGTFRELHVLKAAATANGSGQVTFSISPAIHITPADNAAVYLDGNASDSTKRCACEVIVDPSSPVYWDQTDFQQNLTFRLIEPLA